MGYNLWMSEDSLYTLSYRMGMQPVELPAEPEYRSEASAEPSRAEMDHIDFLMETLALRLEPNQR